MKCPRRLFRSCSRLRCAPLRAVAPLALFAALFGGSASAEQADQQAPEIAATAAVPLYRTAGASVGQRLQAASAEQGLQQKRVGRVTPLSRESFAALATVAKGRRVSLPLSSAEAVEATVNLVQRDNGFVRVAGTLSDGSGSFFLSSNGKRVSGIIHRLAEKLAYRIDQSGNDEVTLREMLRSQVICAELPRMENEPPRAAAIGALSVPSFNSRPNAVAQLYLDFDGATITDPAWAGGATIQAPAYNLSEAEITTIFQRVKEEFWPFNINVTTSEAKYNNAPVGSRMRCIITPNDQALPGTGGAAYIDSFSKAGTSFTPDVPAFIFHATVVGIAETIAHESGHTFGLNHTGREVPGEGHEEYYKGQGFGNTAWAPIMGVSFYSTVTQWSKGEYQFANNFENQVAIISSAVNGFGYVVDEAGDSSAAAAPLGVQDGVVSQPGIITSAADADFFSFSTIGGAVSIDATVASPSPNLDVALEIQDAGGNAVATASPTDVLPASISANLPAGSFYLKVVGAGNRDPFTTGYSNYGSIGAYALTGTIPGGGGGGGGGNKPNLVAYQPPEWSGAIVVSKVAGTHADAAPLSPADPLFIDAALANLGTAATGAEFSIEVYIDDVLKSTYTAQSLAANTYTFIDDYAAGTLSAGTHTITIKVDPANEIVETNETDNQFTKSVVISGGAPSNDSFASPRALNGTAGRVDDTNVGATVQTGEPSHAGKVGGKSIWYQWTAPVSGSVTFDTGTSSFDTLLGVYVGNTVGGLTEVASNDDAADELLTSTVSFTVTEGITYHIAVDGYAGAAGSVVLNFYSSGPKISSFTPTSGGPGTVVTISGSQFSGATGVRFNGVNAEFLVINDSQMTATAPVSATTGPISVQNINGTGTSATNFTILSGPPNDLFANRVTIGAGGTVSGSNVGGSKEAGEPAHPDNRGGASVWWRWTAPSAGDYVVSTAGSNFDTLLAVYTGNSLGSLTAVASNDDDTSGGRTSRLIITAAAGTTYQFLVDGYDGASGNITLSVKANTGGKNQLANISTRLSVGTGDDVLIGGFIIRGTQPKLLLVRALGPSLPLGSALADPTLELYNSTGLIGTNDDWQDTQDAEIAATGIPPSDEFESAMLVSLDPGEYTAVVRGYDNGTGVGLVEVYDLDRTVDSSLANIATRGSVQTGEKVLIGGLIVQGQGSRRVIVRAIGPSLPLAGKLANPTLEIYDNQGGLVGENDDWRSTQEAEIIATTIPPTNNAESAVVTTLSAGAYTAIVRGKGDTTGVALVEAYGLD